MIHDDEAHHEAPDPGEIDYEELEKICAGMRTELSLFRFLQKNELCEVIAYFSTRKVLAGTVMWREDDRCDYVAILIKGRVEVRKGTEFKDKQIVLGVYGRGSLVGELCMLDNQPRAVTAVALDDVDLLTLTRKGMDALLETHPQTGIRLLKGMLLTVSIRLRKSFARLAAVF